MKKVNEIVMASRKWGFENDRVEINPGLRDTRLSGSKRVDKQLASFARNCLEHIEKSKMTND